MSGMRPRERRVAVLIAVGVAAGVSAGLIVSAARSGAPPEPAPKAAAAGAVLSPRGIPEPKASPEHCYSFICGELDPHQDPFLGDGERVSVAEAAARTSYPLPIPVTNEVSGNLAGIWINPPNEEVAFVWETGLRMWANTSYDDGKWLTDQMQAAGWRAKVAEEPELSYLLTEIDGHPAIGLDKDAELPPRLTDGKGEEAEITGSSLTMAVGHATIQFGSPVHSLDELIELAEQLAPESDA